MNRQRRLLLNTASLLAAFGSHAALAEDSAWRRLADGGCALLLRHAQTVPGIGDPPGFRLDDCATQRNLSEAGRAESRRLGEELRRRGIAFDEVLSSRWCRCIDTARLAFPQQAVHAFEPLNSFFADASTREAQTRALRKYLAGQRAPRRIAMVTHQVNITALTGQSVAMGEGVIVALGGSAGEVLARLRVA